MNFRHRRAGRAHALGALALPLALACSAPQTESEPEVPAVRDCRTTFRFSGDADVERVIVSGAFNGWSETAGRMTKEAPGEFSVALDLPPGDYAYKLIVDGEWVLDPSRPETIFEGGVENSRRRVTDCDEPQIEASVFRVSADGTLEARFDYLDGARGRGLAELRVTLDGTPLEATAERSTSFSVSKAGLSEGKHVLEVEARDAAGVEAPSLYLPFWTDADRFDWDGLVYFPMTDRFRNAVADNDGPVADAPALTNYRGGDFAGITEQIESGYFEDLGVTVLWLSPVVENPGGVYYGDDGRQYTGYHGYWPSALQKTQPRFGTLEELRALTAAAHARGIRVIADLVLNHVHEDHPHYGAYPEWFNGDGSCVCGQSCDWNSRALDCWFSPYLPDYALQSTAVIDTVVEDAMWWLEAASLDGFRVDAVKHFERAVVRNLRAEMNRIESRTGTKMLLLGETFVGEGDRAQIASYVDDSQLHGQFDFPWYWDVLRVIVRNEGSLGDLEWTMDQTAAGYAPDAVMSPMLGNHDVARAYSHAAGDIGDLYGSAAKAQGWTNPPGLHSSADAFDRLRLGFGFLLTQPGLPLIYYGDEVGLPGAGDPDNRRMMPFGADLDPRQKGLLEHVGELGRLRRALPALRAPGTQVVYSEPDVLVYLRGLETADPAIVALHRGSSARVIEVELPPEIYQRLEPSVERRIGRGTETLEDGIIRLSLDPWSVEIFSAR